MKKCLREAINGKPPSKKCIPSQSVLFPSEISIKSQKIQKKNETWKKMIREEILWQYLCLEKKLGKTPTEQDVNEAHKKGEMIDVFRFLRKGLFEGRFNNIPLSLKLPVNRRTEWGDDK